MLLLKTIDRQPQMALWFKLFPGFARGNSGHWIPAFAGMTALPRCPYYDDGRNARDELKGRAHYGVTC